MRRRLVVGLAAGLFLLAGHDRDAPLNLPEGGQPAVFISAMRLTSQDPDFGGLSGLHVDRDGRGFLAISDRNSVLRADMLRDAGGRLITVDLGRMQDLPGSASDGRSKLTPDSEGLAVAADGRMFVSYERAPRIAALAEVEAGAQTRAVDLPANPAFVFERPNAGLEALAIDAVGTLYAVPEELSGPVILVHPFRAGAWRAPLPLPRLGNFRPVAADIGPDGRFYLLERRIELPGGFASRLRRFDLDARGLSAGITLLQTRSGRHDNLEGLSVWRAPDGLRATMVSDDNFLFLQVTEIVEYHLPD